MKNLLSRSFEKAEAERQGLFEIEPELLEEISGGCVLTFTYPAPGKVGDPKPPPQPKLDEDPV